MEIAALKGLLHGHHTTLISWGREYGERKAQILAHKPEGEHATRLRCMQTLTPEAIADLPPQYVKAWAECDKAWAECDKAWAEYVKALAEYDKALAEYVKARDECRDELDAWHAKWCAALRTPEGCPWDGERLVEIGD